MGIIDRTQSVSMKILVGKRPFCLPPLSCYPVCLLYCCLPSILHCPATAGVFTCDSACRTFGGLHVVHLLFFSNLFVCRASGGAAYKKDNLLVLSGYIFKQKCLIVLKKQADMDCSCSLVMWNEAKESVLIKQPAFILPENLNIFEVIWHNFLLNKVF